MSGVDTVVLVRCRLDDPPIPHAELAHLLSDTERARASRFRFERDRRRYEASTGLLRAQLGATLEVDPASLRFEVGEHGKPFLAGGPAFNVSHSGEWWLCGVASDGRLGVDVEVHRELSDLEDVARHTFHPRETAEVLAVAGSDRRAAFFRVWSRKEAFIKAVGAGLAYPLDGFVVSAGPEATLVEVRDPEEDVAGWRLDSLEWDSDLSAAVAWDRPGGRFEWADPPTSA